MPDKEELAMVGGLNVLKRGNRGGGVRDGGGNGMEWVLNRPRVSVPFLPTYNISVEQQYL
jgi:hypothetical protein